MPVRHEREAATGSIDRESAWARLAGGDGTADGAGDAAVWDLVVVGGGITGAGLARVAARRGLRTLLVERADFASGTSSRSSKLVHGGLRYLASGQPRLTYESVRESERLIAELPGLVERIGFLFPTYRGDHPGRLMYEAGLTAYDLLAGGRTHHRFYKPDAFELLAPHLRRRDLRGGFRYEDAVTDDARLTIRVVEEAVAAGAVAINYVEAVEPLRNTAGRVTGVALHDCETGRTVEARGRVLVNATGAWADRLRERLGGQPRIRPLRGSHVLFPAARLPVAQAVSFLHPADHRPIFVIPWEGVTVYGTTDVDTPLEREQAMSDAESDYLLDGLAYAFPSLDLRLDDAVSSIAGVRPVVGTGKADPSKESRDHVVWDESGLITVTGGKLTTFELIARDAMRAVERRLGGRVADATRSVAAAAGPAVTATPAAAVPLDGDVAGSTGSLALDAEAGRRLSGRYGRDMGRLLAAAAPGELEPIGPTTTLWAEVRWAARAEAVVHLDDLLLRRVRIGLLVPDGAAAHLPRIRAIAQPELGWDDEQWLAEEARYREVWRREHSTDARR